MKVYRLFILLLAIVVFSGNPGYPINEAILNEVLEDASQLKPRHEKTLRHVFPGDHPFNNDAIPAFSQALLRLEEATKEGQRPEVKLLAFREAHDIYKAAGMMFEAFDVIIRETNKVIENDGFEEGQTEPIPFKEFTGGFGEFLPPLEQFFDKEMVTPLTKAIRDFQTLEGITLPEGKADALAKMKGIQEGLTVFSQPIRVKCKEVSSRFFEALLTAPTLCPHHALNWRVHTLNIGREYCEAFEESKRLSTMSLLEGIFDSVIKELETAKLTENEKGDLMVALLRPHDFKIFKEKPRGEWASLREADKLYLPKPLPEAALLFRWAQLYGNQAKALMKAEGESKEKIVSSLNSLYTMTFKALSILENEDTVPKPKDAEDAFIQQFATVTQGMTRTLALQMIQKTFGMMQSLGKDGIGSQEEFKKWRGVLASRAVTLIEGMVFARRLGDEEKYSKACAYDLLSSLFDNPILKYMYFLLADTTYKGATYNDVFSLHSEHSNQGHVFARRMYLEKEQNGVSTRANKAKEPAFEAAYGEAKSLHHQAKETENVEDKLALLTKAETMARVAGHVAGTTEAQVQAVAALKAPLDEELTALLNQKMEAHTLQFDDLAARPVIDNASFNAKLSQLKALIAGFSDSLKSIHGAFTSTSKPYENWELKWKLYIHSSLEKAFNHASAHTRKLRDVYGQYIEDIANTYRKRADAGESPEALAAEYEKDLLRLREEVSDPLPLSSKVELIPELKVKAKVQAIKGAKSLAEAIKAHREARDVLQGLQGSTPQVFNVDNHNPIPPEWKRALANQTRKVDTVLVDFVNGFQGALNEPGVPACCKALEDFELMANFIRGARHKEEPYNLSSLYEPEDGINRFSYNDPLPRLMEKYGEGSVKKFKSLLALVKKVEESPLKFSDLEELFKEIYMYNPNRLYHERISFVSNDYADVLTKRAVERVLAAVEALPLETFLKVISEEYGKFGSHYQSQLEAVVKKKFLSIFEEKKKVIAEKRAALDAEESAEGQLAKVSELIFLVQANESLIKLYFMPPNNWSVYTFRRGFFSCEIARGLIHPGVTSSDLEFVRRTILNGIQQKEAAEARARQTKESKERKASPVQVRKEVKEPSATEIQEPGARLEEVRKKANAVKEIAKSDAEKGVQYKAILGEARELLSAIAKSGQKDTAEMRKIHQDLKTMIEKLEDCVKKYCH